MGAVIGQAPGSILPPAGSVTPAMMASFASLGNYADDAAAATGGVAVGGLYRNGSVLMVRVS